MSGLKIYCSIVIFCFITIFTIVVCKPAFGQNNLQLNNIESFINTNLNGLDDLYCWTDEEFYPGNFHFDWDIHFNQEFDKLKLSVFPDLQPDAESFYYFLNTLDLVHKKKLVQFFTFFEKRFETVLKEAHLPGELKYFAPVLSAMNPNAVSHDGKAGVWQLTHFQAVYNGLQVTRLVDERFDTDLSSNAAAGQLKQNLEIFNSTRLAVAGYLVGNTLINNIIKENDGNLNFMQLCSIMPELEKKIAFYQAMAVFLTVNRFEHRIELFGKKEKYKTVEADHLLHFQQVERILNIPEKQLQFLNPQFRYSIVPGNEKVYKLLLPNDKIKDYYFLSDSIRADYDSTLFVKTSIRIEYPPEPGRKYLNEPKVDLEIEGKTKIKYRIKSGDVLGIIAEKYDVRLIDLKSWNNIVNERKIQVDQDLVIFIENESAVDFLKSEAEKQNKKEAEKMVEQLQSGSTLKVLKETNLANRIEHIVQNGESAYSIAKKYERVSPEEILEWNGIDNPRRIQVGQKLIIYINK